MLFDIKPCDGRIVFADTEFNTLDRRRREVWEIGLVIRDPGEEDVEVEWQVRPPLSDASPDSLRIGRYYRRCLIQDRPVGTGLLIVGPQWPEITEDEAAKGEWSQEREISAGQIAAQVARILDGAYVVGKVTSTDELTLDRFLYQWEHALTSHYRTRCVETMAHGYLLGRVAEIHQCGRAGLARALAEQIPPPPWDPKVLAELVGVQPPPPEQAHRALVDARLARDVWDAIHRLG